jgi:hypothetical protein
MAEVALKVP